MTQGWTKWMGAEKSEVEENYRRKQEVRGELENEKGGRLFGVFVFASSKPLVPSDH